MSGIAHLRSLAQGVCPTDDGLLGNARCQWGGVELISGEAIIAEFTAVPFDLEGALHAVETGDAAALIGADRALYADLYDGRIGRLWRIGGAPSVPPPPAVDVAFDVDMHQERGDLSFRAEDHPTLAPGAAEHLIAASGDLLEGVRRHGDLRVRGFVVRACGTTEASAALIALYTMSNAFTRSAAFSFAAVGAGATTGDVQAVREGPNARPWTPRL